MNFMDINKIILPSNKKFGLSFSAVFFIFGLYFSYKSTEFYAYLSYLLSIIFLTLAFIIPSYLYYLNKYWMLLGFFLGSIINPIILGFIYFLILTPFAIIRKQFTRDELNLSFNNHTTYWEKRIDTKISSKSFFKQY